MDVVNNRRATFKKILNVTSGNFLEQYDFFLFGFYATYIAAKFFHSENEYVSLMMTFTVFAAGFLMRPLGAIFLGAYVDRVGRRKGLIVTLSLMAIGTILITFVPGYETIGIVAPALLVLARLMQGLSVGGEYGASATYLSEMAGKSRRGFFSSFQYVTLISGQLLAILLLIVLQRTMETSALESWGWRIPFFIGALLAVVVFWLRRGLAETESFKNAKATDAPKSGFWTLIKYHPKETALVMLLTAGGTLAFYAYSIYMQKFLVNTSGFSREVASQINAITLFIFMCLQPVAGALSDKIGRKPLMIAFGAAGVLFTYPIFSTLEQTRDPWVAGLLVMGALIIVTGYTSINAVVKAELFPAHIRALGVALPYALANTLFGGTAEYVALSFKNGGWERGFYWYVTFMIGISLIVYLRMRDTSKDSLITED